MENNAISDLSPLQSLANLTLLHLDNNDIADISALANLINLTELYLNSNAISDISALRDLTSLEHLELDDNSISDISWLVENSGLGRFYNDHDGDYVAIRYNLLDCSDDVTLGYIATLEGLGVLVAHDCD